MKPIGSRRTRPDRRNPPVHVARCRVTASSFALRASEDRSSYGEQVASNPPTRLLYPFEGLCVQAPFIGQMLRRLWLGRATIVCRCLGQPTSCERKGSIYEIPHDSCGRGRSSGLVAVRLRPRRMAALRHRGRLLSRSRRGSDSLRSRRRVCSPSKPAGRPPLRQRGIWRSSPRRPQGMLPVLLKHFPHRTLIQPRWTPGRRKKMRPVLLGIEAHRFTQSAARWA